MKFIVYDTETTGLPASKDAKMTSTELWPHIVQLSYLKYDSERNQLEEKDSVIKVPENVVMDEKNIAIHGITNEVSQTKGVSLIPVIDEFINDIGDVDLVIGHNLEFDLKMMVVELFRIINESTDEAVKQIYSEKMEKLYSLNKYYCTMKNSINVCKLPSPYKKYRDEYKYPRLDELHSHLFGIKPQKLHNSSNDVLVTFRCFYKLYFEQDICEISSDIAQKIKSLM
jgi:DNA polymerase III epsilon subunit-like protein|uniref:Exonuclease domain-containing protein n=1 Tax=viral metagenome TaxID=1070528 RepID=A0A6C0CWY9_9ZZZZ